MVLGVLAAAALALAGCGSDSDDAAGEYAALCEIDETIESGDLATANDEFLDSAHQWLHDLSNEVSGSDREKATSLLEATERFESHIAAGDDATATARSLELLMFEVEGAYASLGISGATSCASGEIAASDVLVAEVASYDVAVGTDERLLVGVFGNDMTFLSFGTVDLELRRDGELLATYAADFLPVPDHGTVEVAQQDSPTLTRPSEARGVYEAQGVEFDQPGVWEVTVIAQVDGSEEHATSAFLVADQHAVVMPGDLTPRTTNPLPGDPNVAPKAIDSRADSAGAVPDPELHASTIADHIDAGRPAVVVVSTPVFCVSRFCGPITDMVADLADRHGDDVGFVHLEVWEDFASNSLNAFALEWIWPGEQGDPAEPWVFLIGADGRLLRRWDNVVDADELEAAVQDAISA